MAKVSERRRWTGLVDWPLVSRAYPPLASAGGALHHNSVSDRVSAG